MHVVQQVETGYSCSSFARPSISQVENQQQSLLNINMIYVEITELLQEVFVMLCTLYFLLRGRRTRDVFFSTKPSVDSLLKAFSPLCQ